MTPEEHLAKARSIMAQPVSQMHAGIKFSAASAHYLAALAEDRAREAGWVVPPTAPPRPGEVPS